MIELSENQIEAVKQLHNGSILCAPVGSGKSRTALAYYYISVCQGSLSINGTGEFHKMRFKRDLYIITTAKKRDSKEWEDEMPPFVFEASGVKVTVDSWNNIKKYREVFGAFFIFDEQRVVGSGSWVKSFLNITRKNQWILLSATPGDQWKDYIPVFVANGYFRNKTEFNRQHVIFARFSKYPKIERYIGEKVLNRYRDSILVTMKDERITNRHYIPVICNFDKEKFKKIYVGRWDIYENKPIEETAKLCYLMRKLVNSDPSRIVEVSKILESNERVIIFYNFDFELELLKDLCEGLHIKYAEWNGHTHEELPKTKRWVYLVHYAAGCEGWNCTSTNVIVFYSQSYSYRMTEQACGRIDRMNTTYVDLYYYILRSKSVIDLAIARAIANKKDFNERSFKLKMPRVKKGLYMEGKDGMVRRTGN